MKHLILVFLVTSCGFATNKDLNKVKDRVEVLENKVAALEIKVAHNETSINNINTTLGHNEAVLELLKQDLLEADFENSEAIQNEIDNRTADTNNLLAMIQMLQTQTTELLAKQAALELEDRVVAIHNPCPQIVSTTFEESLFQMSSGKLVAYFEDGNKRFLTVLKNNTTYRTTDSRQCIFSV